jgi:hypothetical protein
MAIVGVSRRGFFLAGMSSSCGSGGGGSENTRYLVILRNCGGGGDASYEGSVRFVALRRNIPLLFGPLVTVSVVGI